MSTRGLSKSRMMAGIQCPKRLYLHTHQPDLADDSGTEYPFLVGKQVGKVARTLYPGGILIEHQDDLPRALAETESLLTSSNANLLFEPAIQYDGVLIRADVLAKKEEGLHLVEVKASTSVKPYHVYDCAIQAWVVQGAGHVLERVVLAHVNRTFVYEEEGNYEGLLQYVDLTEEALGLQDQVAGWVDQFRSMLAGPCPEVSIGKHCTDPFACPFIPHCRGVQPEFPVALLPRGRKVAQALHSEGITDIRDIPSGRLKSDTHERIRRVTVSGQPEINPDAGDYLKSLPYPRYYLDFETIGFAVPIWLGTRPYQQLPFQWSCHIEYENGELEHKEFLDTSGQAPMRPLTEKLIASHGSTGPVLTYTAYEKTVINGLIKMFPDLAKDLEAIIDRIVDLHPITRDNYYHPDMKGSWSIKAVLPTIGIDASYEELDTVKDGLGAGVAYQEIIQAVIEEERKILLENALVEYCKLDTMAMVRLARFLQQ